MTHLEQINDSIKALEESRDDIRSENADRALTSYDYHALGQITLDIAKLREQAAIEAILKTIKF